MTYSDFTLEQLRRSFGFAVKDQPLFDPIGSLEPTGWLKQALANGISLAVVSEKARSEFIVAPILMSLREMLAHRFQVFSGARLDVDPDRGLKGEADFILAKSQTSFALQSPLMVVLEAKKNDIEEGLGQCGAQMFGAQLYNQRDGVQAACIYGCVTTGELWQFLKLDGSELLLHPRRFPLQEIGNVLWFLASCLEDFDRRAAAVTAA
jgi:hypothetical protein